MYVPKNMEMTNFEAIEAFISEFGFGTLVSPDLEATRLPLLYQKTSDGNGFILGHMARANPQWKDLSGKRVTVLFNGPHSYISPTWYVSQPAVSTWNYAQVQCFGVFTELDITETAEAINTLITKYEPEILNNHDLMPQEYMDRLLKAVVGFKIQIDRIDAKEKLGQHKNIADQNGVYEALSNSSSLDSVQLARYMKHRNLGDGS
jgi:transcriptional regulator